MAKVLQEMCVAARRMTFSALRNYSSAQAIPLQEAALEERCILIDELDRPLGEATKRDCHTVSPEGRILLHRAFSVFLFNKKGELLIQKRSADKITFPNCYTNSCCSHPLAEIPQETEEHNALGVRKAAQRRLDYELGIPTSQVPLTDLFYLCRIHYQSAEGLWGENEIDYVLFLQKDDVSLNPNLNEVSEVHWVPRSEITQFVQKLKSPLTPWFDLMLKHKLLYWWDNLHALDKIKDHTTIHRYL